jgi:hypothetical protein
MDGTWSPDELVTFSGAAAAAGTADHTTSGPGRGRSAPPYSYASAISSARTGSRLQPNTNVAVPLAFQAYYEPLTAGTDDGWASTSASGSSSMNGSENLSGFPFSGKAIVPTPQLLLQQYGREVESQTSYVTPLETQFRAQQLDQLWNPTWGGDTGFDDAGDPGEMAGFSFSPVSAASHFGSNVDDSAASPEMSGSETNFGGTAGLANYASASAASAPVSPVSSRDRHDRKRSKAKSSDTGRELRSASRTSKNTRKVTGISEQQKSRSSHNLVEKQYRNRLTTQFEDLLAVLPESGLPAGTSAEASEGDDPASDDRLKMSEKKRVSKGEVLEMARQRILFLEEENKKIERKNEELRRTEAGHVESLNRQVVE